MATSVTIKMYRVGELGDCFLLTFLHNQTTRHMLIDCGSFRNGTPSKNRLRKIANDIRGKVNDKLDIVVGTHQHNDHVNGFVHAEDIFNNANIGQAWLSWLDDPRNKQAARIGENHLKLRKALVQASSTLARLAKSKSPRIGNRSVRKMRATHKLVDEVLGFFGAAPQLPLKGIQNLRKIGASPAAYLSPGECKRIPGIPASAIRIHVLGPPKDEDLLYRKNPRKGESYDHKLQSLQAMAAHFMAALDNRSGSPDHDELQFPFNHEFKNFRTKKNSSSKELRTVTAEYAKPGNAWRTIDDDWMEQAARLALYMDTFTNNSSLVLAIELVKSGKVLLFAADAQTGNWIAWNNVVFKDKSTTIDSLLARTTLYKVGHHGSHNATLKDALEKMTSPELVAMIPVDKSDPNITKRDGWRMPAENLYKRLKEKTHNRVLRMDDGFADECDPAKNKKAKTSWNKLPHKPKDDNPLFIEYTVE